VEPAIAIYDACVLYSAPLRSFLMYLALTDLFQARWTDAIHEEWMRSVQRDYPDVTREKAERVRDLMNAHVRDCLVTGYKGLIPSLTLPDPDDRHVLAAAIHTRASVIVTSNLNDFPREALAPHQIEPVHPDEFAKRLLEAHAGAVCGAAKKQRLSLKNPPKTVDEFLAILERCGLPLTVAKLRLFADLI
jgi:hypothetical protein